MNQAEFTTEVSKLKSWLKFQISKINSFYVDDIYQDTLIKAWLQIKTFDCDKAKFQTWVLAIAKNTAIDYIRERKALISTIQELREVHAHTEPENNIPETVDLKHFLELAPKELRCLKLKLKGYDSRKIARMMGIEHYTVSRYIRRAIIKLA